MKTLIPFIMAIMAAPATLTAQSRPETANGPLSGRVRQERLNQRDPVEVRTSVFGATTLQFPARIQAIEGEGLATKPAEVSADFLISNGPNWVTVRALHAGACQNLNVVIDGRVYPIYLAPAAQNDFAVLFQFAGPGLDGAQTGAKTVTEARLLGLMDKLRGYPTFATLAPAMYTDMDVNEPPAAKATVQNDRVTARIVRVLRDAGLAALGFEVEFVNRSTDELSLDLPDFKVRAGTEVYSAAASTSVPFKVPVRGRQTAFFVITGAEGSGVPSALSAYNDFQFVL